MYGLNEKIKIKTISPLLLSRAGLPSVLLDLCRSMTVYTSCYLPQSQRPSHGLCETGYSVQVTPFEFGPQLLSSMQAKH